VHYVFKIYDTYAFMVLVDDCLHTNMTQDAFHNLFSVERLCRQ